MKIAITVSQITPGGGLTKYICTLIEILTKSTDNDVWLITTHPSKANPTIERFVKEKKINYISLSHLPLIRKYISLISVLRKINPDVIINNYNAPTQYTLPFLPSKIKIVHILHNNTEDFYRVAAINGKYVNQWIAPTPALAQYFDEYTHQKYSAQITVIPHGVENPICPSIKSEIPQLTYVGVLYEHKGVKILPDIIKKLLDKQYNFHFTFIGDGILRTELEKRLSQEIQKGFVEFTGRISGEEVYRRLSKTDIFVYPTHIDAFGLVIAEAMINQAIPVVTLLPGITDSIIDNGTNGYLIEKDNIEMFVDRITQLLDDSTLMDTMREKAKDKVLNHFSIEKMTTNYTDFINKLFCKTQ